MDPVIDFTWIKFIGRTKLKLSSKETGRLTIKQFRKEYQCYKNDFDLELSLKLSRKTYAGIEAEQIQSEEWF